MDRTIASKNQFINNRYCKILLLIVRAVNFGILLPLALNITINLGYAHQSIAIYITHLQCAHLNKFNVEITKQFSSIIF